MATVEVVDLAKRYRQGDSATVEALAGVSLTIDPGELVSLHGGAGSGKTTLLHSIGLLVRPTTGKVLIDDIDTGTLTDGQRADMRGRRIGFVFRDPGLLPTLDVLQNVQLPLRYAPMGRAARSRAGDLLDAVGMGDRLRDRPEQLTVGQAQRVAIARALVKEPDVVLADEPTGDVDSDTSDELLDLLEQLNRMSGVSFVIATQDAVVASRADRMVRLRDGRAVSGDRTRLDLGSLSGLR